VLKNRQSVPAQTKQIDPSKSPKRKLIGAAIALFAEKGYASTSVNEIVTQADVSKPVLYYYFGSKEGMFHAILDWASERQEVILAEALKMSGTALERLQFLYQRIYQGLIENPNLFKMIHNLIFGPPQGAPPYDFRQYHGRLADTIKRIFLEGRARNELAFANPDDVAVLVLGVIDFCIRLGRVGQEQMDPDRSKRLLNLVFRGLERK
jgi:TetR/AcrR family transcriptional regulator